MIELCGITQHYGVRPVLRDVELRIESAELTAIVGPNEMGKSTLLAVMAGVLSPQKGYVEVDGLRRRRTEEEESEIRRRIVYLPDHPWLPVNRTGREFLLGVGRLYEVNQLRLFDHIDRLLMLFELAREGDWTYRKSKRHFSAGPDGVQPPELPLGYPGGGDVARCLHPAPSLVGR